MYSWSRSVVDKKDENPFWNGQGFIDFIKDVYDEKVFVGKYSNLGIWISKVNTKTFSNINSIKKNIGTKNLF